MKKLVGSLFLLGLAMMPARSDAASLCVSTTSCTFQINQASSGTGLNQFGNYGTVSLSLVSNAIVFNIDLIDNPSLRLIDTGAHVTFGFNANTTSPFGAAPTIGVTGLPSPYSLISTSPGTIGQPGFGDFTYAIQAGSPCTNGGTTAQAQCANTLSFTVTKAGGFSDVNQLIAGNGSSINAGFLFSMDITNRGSTGAIGVGFCPPESTACSPPIRINEVPEPQSAALLGTGLVGLAFVAKRMRRK